MGGYVKTTISHLNTMDNDQHHTRQAGIAEVWWQDPIRLDQLQAVAHAPGWVRHFVI
jgi:hypothetical protein